jgi:sulfide:quinone oxidoreductase
MTGVSFAFPCRASSRRENTKESGMSSGTSSHVVIIGGGTGGITVAARLRKQVPEARVTVIEPSEHHYYQPLWTLVGGGIVDKRESKRSEASVIPSGVEWMKDAVVELDPERSQVVTAGGARVGYDFLVVAPGIQMDWSAIRGLPERLGKGGVCSNYAYEHVDSTWQFLRAFRGGTAVFTQPSTPIKCAGAPQKIMYLAEEWLCKAGVRDRSQVIFASAGKVIFGVERYARTLRHIVAERHIETRFEHDLIEVRDGEAIFRHLGTGEERVISYDFLHVTPPMSAPDFVKRSPLADSGGWVEVDKHTLQHTRHINVFALGDASSLPTSRTGAAIRKQAPVLVSNLRAAMLGKPLEARYDGYASCPLVTGYSRVILAEFGYDGEIMETFPFDQSKERYTMYLLKRHGLPALYWHGMLKGRA